MKHMKNKNNAMEFLNGLSAILHVDDNNFREATMTARVFPDFRELTDEERNMVVLTVSAIRLKSEGGVIVEHKAPNGKHFTVQDILDCVVETERQTREKSDWFGGPDLHHVFFEGIHKDEHKDFYRVWWGS